MFIRILKYLLIFAFSPALAQPATGSASGKWWKETVFYQIYMPSFQDSDGNGISDFKGMTDRLDYLKSLGIKGIWLTPFLRSPGVDNGYDVADYYQVDSMYGTNTGFSDFLKEAHQRGIKVIMDMVVNHTSTECRWFQESVKSRDNPYRDYYIWRDKPNNWESFFGGSAWEFEPLTKQYYYHKFDVRMADLNWTNPAVVQEIQEVLRYWLDLGVDGFRMDVINFLTTGGIGPDNPVNKGKQDHRYDIEQSGIKEAIRLIRSTLEEYDDRFIVGEIGSDKTEILRQYQAPDLMDVVFNFNFGSIPEFSVERIFNELQTMEQQMPGYPTLFFGSHDMPRLMDRLAGGNTERARAMAALMLTAKGVPFIYYGEEIGMQNIEAVNHGEIVDIQGITHYNLALKEGKSPAEALTEGNLHNRDKSRSPMQWTAGINAGFSSGKPWIKIQENFRMVNVQQSLLQDNSLLNTYKKLIKLRNSEPILQYGGYEKLEMTGEMIGFTRILKSEKITVIVNFGKSATVVKPENSIILMGSTSLEPNEFLIFRH